MIYKIDHQSGQRLVSDSRVGASAFTGSRAAGMALKNAADAVGKPIYLEMSSINPVVDSAGRARRARQQSRRGVSRRAA